MIPVERSDRKTDVLVNHLRALAYQMGPRGKLPPLRTLCEQFATTRVTLDGALRILEKERIIERKLGSGIYVSAELHYKRICILLNGSLLSLSPFWGILYSSIADMTSQRAQEHEELYSFHFLLPSSEAVVSLPDELRTTIDKGHLDAIVGIAIGGQNGIYLSRQPIPFVSYASWGHYHFRFDMNTFLRLAVEQLVRQGCRTIALWMKDRPDQQLYEHMQEVFLYHGIPFQPEQLHYPPAHETRWSVQRFGYDLTMEVFRQDSASWPDGIICMEDMVTDGALLAFQHLQIPLGSRVRIASHANAGSPILFGRTHDLTLIEFDPRQLVHALFSLLARLLSGEHVPQGQTILTPRIRAHEQLEVLQ